jgi:hypothetical protein
MNKSLTVSLSLVATCLAALLLSGCASTDNQASGGDKPSSPGRKFKTDDGRTIDIGKSAPAEGGTSYDNPHMVKGKCWVTSGFNFTGYDTIYLSPTLSTAKFPDKPADQRVHDLAKERLVIELTARLTQSKLFANVVTKESDINPGAKTLKLENTITEFSKGGGGARFWAGEFGAGQPVLRVQGRMQDGAKSVFTYETRRTGVSAGARMAGSFMKDEDIQSEDVRSMVLDLTDFMAALAGKYQPKN